MCLASHSHLCSGPEARGNPRAPSIPQSPSQSRLAAASPRWDVLQLTEPLSRVNGPINKGANRFCVAWSVRSLCGPTALVTVMKCRKKEGQKEGRSVRRRGICVSGGPLPSLFVLRASCHCPWSLKAEDGGRWREEPSLHFSSDLSFIRSQSPARTSVYSSRTIWLLRILCMCV